MSTTDESVKEQPYPDEKTLRLLEKGFLEVHEKDLKTVKKDLDYLLSKQVCIENELKKEKQNYSEEKSAEIQDMMETIRIYRDKLVNIKKQMTSIHQRSNNLKKRTQDLQEFTEKERLARIQKRQQEEGLIANSMGQSSTSIAEEAVPR